MDEPSAERFLSGPEAGEPGGYRTRVLARDSPLRFVLAYNPTSMSATADRVERVVAALPLGGARSSWQAGEPGFRR
ncbi:hypothetical protein [Streptomyces lasiicapitis]|uniref:hypothetical protein n=1 Tax=Streptomyces lasiicapitis TaxID=1923961 RepID=UPI0016632DEC|nr:hypothetical protein [Streptomyces lasiicapitis]